MDHFNRGSPLKRIAEAFTRWGKSHFSIMLIPHSEKKIFSFQISNFIIFFILMILLTGGLTVYLHYSHRQQVAANLAAYKKQDEKYWKIYRLYKKFIRQNDLSFSAYAKDIYNILAVCGYDQELLASNRKNYNLIKKELASRYNINSAFVPENIIKLKQLEDKVKNAVTSMSNIASILHTRKKLLNHIPTRWPVMGNSGYKTSGFGIRISPFDHKKRFHTGVDIAAYPRTPILAAADGVVSFAGIKSGFGYTVVIRHKLGFKTLYGHNARVLVRNGQRVKKGQKIARLGKSGRATGYHVHFEIRIHNKAVDPWPYLTTEF
ncbi:MAG TPA: M23 family metallopeptidase [Spirochaetota bacterium]|nr:M23 family metallopeptidase [Spirochaetota bacterium]